jgi:6-pyruvoyltetrahydropterin/6-carboxytetrahydropterin synthase
MYEISKTFTFAASHRLDGLEPGHKCARLHGHNYTVTVTARAPTLDGAGMVIDYADLDPVGDWIKATLDHRHLGAGDVCDPDGKVTDPAVLPINPTAEHLAAFILAEAQHLVGMIVKEVVVCETPKTSARAI